jgi:hypothetical protein
MKRMRTDLVAGVCSNTGRRQTLRKRQLVRQRI